MSWWPSFKQKIENNFSALTQGQAASMCPTLQGTIKDFNQYLATPSQANAATVNADLWEFWNAVGIPGQNLVGAPTNAGLPPGEVPGTTNYPVSDQQMFAFLQNSAQEMQSWLQQFQAQYCSVAPSVALSPSSPSNTYWIIGITIVSLLLIGAVLAFVLLQK